MCQVKIDPEIDPKPLIDPKIDPAPSLDYWDLGNTTLAARMGETPFIVACTRAHTGFKSLSLDLLR